MISLILQLSTHGLLKNHCILQRTILKVNLNPSLCYVRYMFTFNPAKWTSKSKIVPPNSVLLYQFQMGPYFVFTY